VRVGAELQQYIDRLIGPATLWKQDAEAVVNELYRLAYREGFTDGHEEGHRAGRGEALDECERGEESELDD
jgi:flagellar biosynthesis/type III secretory pathway protein FliH